MKVYPVMVKGLLARGLCARHLTATLSFDPHKESIQGPILPKLRL